MIRSNKWYKTLAVAMIAMLILSACSSGSGGNKEQASGNNQPKPSASTSEPAKAEDPKQPVEKKVIVVDPGGDFTDYAPTTSMEKSDANPHPYNEIRVLADEWEKLHPEAKIEILSPTKSKDRKVAIAQLAAGTAADIIYQIGVFKDEDYPKGWVLPFDKYLDMPNPYAEGNAKWKDLYNETWLNKSGDGKVYYIPIDAVPIGIIFNKELFAKAGIDKPPVTYTEFFEAEKKLKAIGVAPYMPIYRWSDITLETAVFAKKIKEWDVLTPNGIIDQEEFVRAYKKDLYQVDSPENREYYKLKKEKTDGYPKGWNSTDAYKAFVTGKVAMIEAVGIHMRNVQDDKERKFDYGTMSFPILSQEESPFGGANTIRGTAGYATAWQLTNSAEKKGTADLAADFLMYLTSPKNNARLVNKLEAAIPAANGAEAVEMFKPMYDQFQQDYKDGYLTWGAFYAAVLAGPEYGQAYEKLSVDYLLGSISLDKLFVELGKAMKKSVNSLVQQHKYDESKW
ncbi:hypothetical protein Back11_59550 [Paenibacillus baekrokdamisoli]|uniref:Uncharacterized protein n=1 Tax=Paenibacillus baekrokdamisoli TaxID=1712516 RepID=A0A3G9J0B3_9BACL|nr:extracellular solute-binding protein [Paenibacillus baekrokdamisoli]MBB3071354.1 ABC-type glycerol-3-phosphate transport system substrate-binding protein [Paenibacillus baekrokdamisoli]BBH24610.1 hypothetical protein Back11_59550 [Paenibacillus baekrokdamisoli]